MIHYILQVLLFQILFLAVYDLFLKKETFFQWNRVYLITTSVLAYIIPLLKFEHVTNYVQENITTGLPEVFLFPENLFTETTVMAKQSSNSLTSIESIYALGVLITLSLFLYKIKQIIDKIISNKIIKNKDYKLVILAKKNVAFSFFHFLFLGKKILATEHKHIISHELIHIKQKHSWDLLFFEIQKIIFWFNPFSYIFQHKISALHEFIADAKTIKEDNKVSFFENLLNQTFQVEKFAFVNHFYKKSLLKKRILMATKKKSKEIIKLKYLLLVPVLASMMIYTSCSVKSIATFDVDETNTQITEIKKPQQKPIRKKKVILVKNKVQKRDTIKPTSKEILKKKYAKIRESLKTYHGEKVYNAVKVENWPHFENSTSSNESSIQIFLDLMEYSKKIDKTILKNAHLKEWVGVYFVIDKNGKVQNINTDLIKDELLKKEVVRLLHNTPKIIPGKQNGVNVHTFSIMTIRAPYNRKKEDKITIPFVLVKESPIYPGCENSADKKKCFAAKMVKYTSQKFDTDAAQNLGLSPGNKKIRVLFEIGKDGYTHNVKVRAPHPKLEEEVKRLIHIMPQVIPGKKDGKAVITTYNLPIVFVVAPKPNKMVESVIHEVEGDVEEEVEEEVNEDISFSLIETVPVFKGCENETDKKKCFRNKITQHIKNNFDYKMATNLGLDPGKKRIRVRFRINKNGNIENIRSRSPHPKLDIETKRILKLIPKMIPGKQRGKAVKVMYTFPINFTVLDLNPSKPSQLEGSINGHSGNVTSKKSDILFATIKGVDSNTKENYEINSFQIKVPKHPAYKVFGNKLDEKCNKLIRSAKKDNIVIIFNIKAKNVSDKVKDIIITIK